MRLVDPAIPPPRERTKCFDEPLVRIKPISRRIEFEPELFEEINHELWLRNTRQKAVDAIESHGLFVQSKLAALLTFALDERSMVTREDWDLAGHICSYSRAVRLYTEREAAALQEAEDAITNARFANRGLAVAAATRNIDERVKSIARRIAKKVHKVVKNRDIRNFLPAHDRPLLDEAVRVAEELHWIVMETNGLVPQLAGDRHHQLSGERRRDRVVYRSAVNSSTLRSACLSIERRVPRGTPSCERQQLREGVACRDA